MEETSNVSQSEIKYINMKCFYCKKEIDESKPYEITAPDGDCFHKECLPKYKKERNEFFNKIILDDNKYNNWLGFKKTI